MSAGKLPEEAVIYVRSMGKALRVTAIFTDDATANRYMASTPGRNDAVVAEFKPYIFMANRYDQGVPLPREGERT